jgi:selenocysteine lyase/cysteine desulfurase
VTGITGTTDIAALRADFPALDQTVSGGRLVYLDTAATSQKPNAVIDAVRDYYRHHNANVHRAAHQLSDRATALFEGARGRFSGYARSRRDHLDARHDRSGQPGCPELGQSARGR